MRETGDDRRLSRRIGLALPACLVGVDQFQGEWAEMTETMDVSRSGCTVRVHRRLRHGMVLRITMPLPAELQARPYPDPNYSVYSIVTRIEPSTNGIRTVALEFIGEEPPEGYLERPWATYRQTRWDGVERRRKAREMSSDVIWIEYLDPSMRSISEEATRTEDISGGGMRVIAKVPPPDFEAVKVSYPNRGFESYAAVCNRYTGSDGFERLCLRFLDHHWYANPGPALKDPVQNDLRVKRILVADDDPPLRKVLSKILSQAGYDVILAEDGKAAVEKTRLERPDLVITDVLMPKMHGFLVCKEIKKLEQPPKVILLTAVYTKPSYKWEAKNDYGADDMIPKPFVVADLLWRIEQQLSSQFGQ